MVKIKIFQFASTAILLVVALLAGGCTTAPRPMTAETLALSPAQAREVLINAVQSDFWCREPKTVNVTYRKIEITCTNPLVSSKSRRSLRISQNSEMVIKRDKDLWIPMTGVLCSPDIGQTVSDCMFLWKGSSAESTARDFLRAWHVLANAADPEEEAVFEHAARSYREALVKPALPEEAVKYKVQAELAVQQKRFDDAVDLYEQALGVAPWWSAGHYNRGLILGEQQNYRQGILSLQKYLRLEPDAPDARAVQLKIYQWESLVPQAER